MGNREHRREGMKHMAPPPEKVGRGAEGGEAESQAGPVAEGLCATSRSFDVLSRKKVREGS